MKNQTIMKKSIEIALKIARKKLDENKKKELNYMGSNYLKDKFLLDLDKFLSSPSSYSDNVITSHDFQNKDKFNRLNFIDLENQIDFCIFLSLLILVDQILFTYSKDTYEEFQKKLITPKIWLCGHGLITSSPFSIFKYVRIKNKQLIDNSNIFFNDFINDFLSKDQKNLVLDTFLKDRDIFEDKYGKLIIFSINK